MEIKNIERELKQKKVAPKLNLGENLKQKLKELPEKSGVYIMRDAFGTIIYVGKAVVLKNRVRSYFQNSHKEPKVAAMVENIADFEYIITISELDAFILEANLIKKHRPRYNILLKDDKSSPYIKIDFKEEYPRIEVVRRIKSDGARYFGPYVSGHRQFVEIIKAAYKLRTCAHFKKGQRACLDHHIGQCLSPCLGEVTREEYRKAAADVCAFLNGKTEQARELLVKRMEQAAENEEFERAINYRNMLSALEKLHQKAATGLSRNLEADFFAYAALEGEAVICVLNVRGGKTLGLKNYPIVDIDQSSALALPLFIAQYYSSGAFLPKEIVLSECGEGIDTITQFLSTKASHAIDVVCPLKGAKAKLILTAKQNAQDYLEKHILRILRNRQMTLQAVEELKDLLNLSVPPRRMECFDISNFSGVDSVASMSVFIDGQPDKKSYRKFKIRTVMGANDFESMREVIKRRLERLGDQSFGDKPDLIVVDGGKGQLSMVDEIVALQGIEIISLAKKREEVFLPKSAQPILLPRASNGLKLLIRIRDEAHRFAITYHKSLRTKKYESELMSIKGVGKVLAQKILAHFESAALMHSASFDELMGIKGMRESTAQAFIEHFKSYALEEDNTKDSNDN